MKHLLLTTIAAVVLVGCGESATDTGKTDVQFTGEKQEAELATFLPGKRIYFRMPMPGDPGVPIEPAESEPKLFSDEPKVDPGEKPTPLEMVYQFEKDGTLTMGMASDGEVEFFEGQKMSYKVNGLSVAGFEDGKEGGDMTFTSVNPKKGDKVFTGEFGEKIPVTITKIEVANAPARPEPSEPSAEVTKPKPPSAKDEAPKKSKVLTEDFSIEIIIGDIASIKKHLDQGTDVNATNLDGNTPLHQAAISLDEKKAVEIVELLISKGANVNRINSIGKTPVDFALDRNNEETADLLRKHGGKTGDELKAEGK